MFYNTLYIVFLILDLPMDQPALEHAMVQRFMHQLQLILLGAAAWRAA